MCAKAGTVTTSWLLLLAAAALVLPRSGSGLRMPLPDNFQTDKVEVELVTDEGTSGSLDEFYPDTAHFRIHHPEGALTLRLDRNQRLIATSHIYLWRDGGVRKSNSMANKTGALYQDPETGAALVFIRPSAASPIRLFGTFFTEQGHHLIQPDADGHMMSLLPGDAHAHTEAWRRRLEAIAATPDDRRRWKRQASSLQVELLTVVDYKIYQFWYNLTVESADRRTDTVNLIALYMAYMVNAVDARFRSVNTMDLSVLHAGLFIADTPEAADWSEVTVTGGLQDSSWTLDVFTYWTIQQNGLPAWDHAMAFTGYDLTSESSGSDTVGVAGLGTICSSESTSLVEWRFDFITMAAAAHELAHSMGADHDGLGTTCSADDSYIMAPKSSRGLPAAKGRHPWLFSTCSQEAFKQRVDILNALGVNCLLKTTGNSREATTPRPMAETYGPDETCVNRYGAGSFVCRSVQSYDAICRGMFCNLPGSTLCSDVLPAEGTPCGAGKWCERGVCISSPQAPSDVTDFCPLGDHPGLFEETGRTCAVHVAANTSACYSPYTEAVCCKSCAARAGTDQSCRYGDHGPLCTTMTRNECYANEEYCCKTCPPLKNAARKGCEFGDKIADCKKYNCVLFADVRASCCETCYDGTLPTVRTTTVRTNRPTTAPTMPTPTRPPTDRTPVAPQENTMSEEVVVALGVGAGALVLAVVVAITCFLYRRRQASKSAPTKRDSIVNNYDNIGFIGALENIAHPPPHTPQSTVTTIRCLYPLSGTERTVHNKIIKW